MYLNKLLIFVLVVGGVLLASLPQQPSLLEQERDSGIFAYTGWVWHSGGLPYQNAWDNKPPGVYLINAAAFAVGGVNRWALWGVELLFSVLTAALFYGLVLQVTRRHLVASIALFVFVPLMRYPGMVMDGNFTESYALLPQVALWWAGWRLLQQPRSGWALLLGVAAGAAFLIKQTTVGAALAFPLVVLMGGVGWRGLAGAVLGGLLTLALFAAWLALHDLTQAFYGAALASPTALHEWVGQESPSVWATLRSTIGTPSFQHLYLPMLPLVVLALGRWRSAWGAWVLGALAVDVLLTNLTNRSYAHYYITPIPALVLVGLLAWGQSDKSRFWLGMGYFMLVGLVGWNAVFEHLSAARGAWFGAARQDPLAGYLMANSTPDERVWVWGASSKINFQARRYSPTPHHYAYGLIVPGGSAVEDDIARVVDDLARERPTIIADRALNDGNRVPPLHPVVRALWLAQGGRHDTANLQPIFDFVWQHCRIREFFGNAAIYTCRY